MSDGSNKRKRRHPRADALIITYYGKNAPDFGWSPIFAAAGQREEAPTTGRLHWQCSMWLNSERSVPVILKNIGACGAHWERIQGTNEQAWNYCTKDETRVSGTAYTKGTCPPERQTEQGRRNDLESICKNFLELGYDGIPDSAIVRFHRGLDKLALVRAKPAKPKVKNVVWYYGPTGTGKSERVYNEIQDKRYYKVPGRGGWFDGYCGQPIVWIDEFGEGNFKAEEILQILDKYSTTLPMKGNFAPSKIEAVYITSHKHPSCYYDLDRWPELERRITRLIDTSEEVGESSITSPTSPPLLPL